MAMMMANLRTLKKLHPTDTFYDEFKIRRFKDADFFDTYQILFDIALNQAPLNILEIGSRTGTSLCQLLSVHSKINRIQSIVCVDPFTEVPGSEKAVHQSLAHFNIDVYVDFKKMKSQEFYLTWPNVNCFDYILIDGSHKVADAKTDLDNCHKLLMSGGTLVFDDIYLTSDGPLLDVWEQWKSEHRNEYFFRDILRGQGTGLAVKL